MFLLAWDLAYGTNHYLLTLLYGDEAHFSSKFKNNTSLGRVSKFKNSCKCSAISKLLFTSCKFTLQTKTLYCFLTY